MGRVATGNREIQLDYSPVLFFDGVCHLCNGSVKFLIKRDKKGVLHYAALQSEYANIRIEKAGIPLPLPDGVILLEEDKYYMESDAILRSLYHLGGFWRLLSFFKYVPRFIRQMVYRLVARNRYSWFGKYDTCAMPEPGWKERFED